MISFRHTLARHFWPLLLALIGIFFTGLMFWSLLSARIPGCSVTPRYVLPAATAEAE
jgi:hypothetical protein